MAYQSVLNWITPGQGAARIRTFSIKEGVDLLGYWIVETPGKNRRLQVLREVIGAQLSDMATERTESPMGGGCVVPMETGHQVSWSRSKEPGQALPLLDAAVVPDSRGDSVALAGAPELPVIFSRREEESPLKNDQY